MSLGAVNVTHDTATPAIQGLMDRLRPGMLAPAIGPAALRCVQRWFRALGANKRGWPTTRFWPRAANASHWHETATGVGVTTAQIGAAQRFHGGVIRAVNKRALTIPVSPVAYGRTASEFPGAFVLRTKKGSYLAQYGESAVGGETAAARGARIRGMGGNRSKRIAASLQILFKLVASVNQAPDPNVLPDKGTLWEAIRGALVSAIKVAARE